MAYHQTSAGVFVPEARHDVTKAAPGLSWPSKTSTWNAWQMATSRTQREFGNFAPVFACWRIISEEIARVPLRVVRRDETGSKKLVTTNAPARVFRAPNQYQVISDFLLYLMQALLSNGNAYAYGIRNNRNEITALYPTNPNKTHVFLDPESGDYFYRISDSDSLSLSNIDDGHWFPSRDMLHIRLFTPDHPLKGVSPLTAAVMGVNAGMNINAQTAAFFGNMTRPSGVITHPKKLEPELVNLIKERFIQATTGEEAGAPVVLQDGMAWAPMSMSAVDAELVESYKLTERQVAQVYRVPSFFLGDMEVAKIASVEALMRYFLNSGLGFYFTHLSNSLTRFFDLAPGEGVEFDYETALLQGDLEGRIQAYAKAVQGGIMQINEARSRFDGLAPVEYGDEVMVQQQMVPLSFWQEGQGQAPEPADDLKLDPGPTENVLNAARRIRVLSLQRQLRNKVAA